MEVLVEAVAVAEPARGARSCKKTARGASANATLGSNKRFRSSSSGQPGEKGAPAGSDDARRGSLVDALPVVGPIRRASVVGKRAAGRRVRFCATALSTSASAGLINGAGFAEHPADCRGAEGAAGADDVIHDEALAAAIKFYLAAAFHDSSEPGAAYGQRQMQRKAVVELVGTPRSYEAVEGDESSLAKTIHHALRDILAALNEPVPADGEEPLNAVEQRGLLACRFMERLLRPPRLLALAAEGPHEWAKLRQHAQLLQTRVRARMGRSAGCDAAIGETAALAMLADPRALQRHVATLIAALEQRNQYREENEIHDNFVDTSKAELCAHFIEVVRGTVPLPVATAKQLRHLLLTEVYDESQLRMLAEGCELELLEEEGEGREVGEAELREALMEELADLLPPAR